MTNDESRPRQAGWQTNRLPTHARTVLVRLDDPGVPVWLAYYDSKKWRSLNRGRLYAVQAWMSLEDAAEWLDRIGNPVDA